MDYTILYVLTVRCTNTKCEEDLAGYLITDIDDIAIYTEERKYLREKLMYVEDIKIDSEEIILRIPFLIKEAAIIWVRDAFIRIKERGTKEMAAATYEEWRKILHPYYDAQWFTGGKKVETWREEMRELIDKL